MDVLSTDGNTENLEELSDMRSHHTQWLSVSEQVRCLRISPTAANAIRFTQSECNYKRCSMLCLCPHITLLSEQNWDAGIQKVVLN